MKQLKKVLTLLPILMLFITMLVACDGSENDTQLSDSDAVATDKATILSLNGIIIDENFDLSTYSSNGTNISLDNSSNTTVIAIDGTITRPGKGEADAVVTLTITISKGSESTTVSIDITVQAISTYTITYDGNTNTSGSNPIDNTLYIEEESVIVLGKGNLDKEMIVNTNTISLYFEGWNTAADGSGNNYKTGDNLTMGTTNVTLYAKWTIIRGIGPAGGYIFYDKGSYSDGWRFMEASSQDLHTDMEWADYDNRSNQTSATEEGIGKGQENTNTIVTDYGTSGQYAARLCAEASIGGYNDWFLPSREELIQMHQNLYQHGVANFPSLNWGVGDYWSSTELSTPGFHTYAFRVGFWSSDPVSPGENKRSKKDVRAARMF